jgi:hypothetical protein
MYIAPLNHAVRYYLRNCPITDGKRGLLAWSKRFIAPTEQWVVSRTRQDFQLRLTARIIFSCIVKTAVSIRF